MAKKAQNAKTYSQMLAELEAIVEWFESDQVDLDEALKKFEQANDLVDKLEDYLKTAGNKIKKLSRK